MARFEAGPDNRQAAFVSGYRGGSRWRTGTITLLSD